MKPTDKYSGLTVERARELFTYDPDTGDLTRRLTLCGRAIAGRVAGFTDRDGYMSVWADGRKYLIHRLAWISYYGVWPYDQLDHIDGNRSNNRIENLREVDNAENTQNQIRPRADNRLGIMGVHNSRGKYLSQIGVAGKNIFLGRFNTPEEAHEAYIKAKRELHPGNTL